MSICKPKFCFQMPLAKRANIKRKASPVKVEEDQEEEPLVKRATTTKQKVPQPSDSGVNIFHYSEKY